MRKVLITDISLVLVPWLWVGLIVGISFIATPVKFRAENLELGVALDIGRHTFNLFNSIEWILLLALIVLFLIRTSSKLQLWPVAALLVIVLLQTFWILPELVARTEAVIEGNPMPPSFHHNFYAVLEVIKLLILMYISIKMFISVKLEI